MTKKELYEMGFESAIEKIKEELDCITTYEILKEFAIEQITEERLLLAVHILEALHNNYSQYYEYDYGMGTLETPIALQYISDLERYCED